MGWIAIDRSLEENWIWKDKPFNRGSAWVDLLMLANHKDKKTIHEGKPIVCKRGDVNYSYAFLADRWGWSRKKVAAFIKALEADGMVTSNATTHRTTITIENYDKYQTVRTTNSTTKEQQRNSRGTAEEQQRNITNNINNINNNKQNHYSSKVNNVSIHKGMRVCDYMNNDDISLEAFPKEAEPVETIKPAGMSIAEIEKVLKDDPDYQAWKEEERKRGRKKW